MIYKITNIDMTYDIKCNDVNAIEQAFRKAQARYRYEDEDYANFFVAYFEDELDKLGVIYGCPTEYVLKW